VAFPPCLGFQWFKHNNETSLIGSFASFTVEIPNTVGRIGAADGGQRRDKKNARSAKAKHGTSISGMEVNI
jgi:hypothetical protein